LDVDDAPLFDDLGAVFVGVGFASSVLSDVVSGASAVESVVVSDADVDSVNSVELESVSVDMIMIIVADVKGCLNLRLDRLLIH